MCEEDYSEEDFLCPVCGEFIESGEVVCPFCGTPL